MTKYESSAENSKESSPTATNNLSTQPPHADMSIARNPTDTPYPPPDEGMTERLGRAIYYAQQLEKELKLLLLAAEAAGVIKIEIKNTDWAHSEEFLSEKALGEVIAVYRKVRGEDGEFIAYLTRVKDARNRLAHKLLRFYNPVTRHGRDAIMKQLDADYLEVGNGFLIVRDLRMLMEEKIGITQEQLEARLQEREK